MEEQFTVKEPRGETTMNRAAYEEYQQALEARRSMGRYSLEEAAQYVADNSNANARSIYIKLEKFAETGKLTIHWPGSDEVYKPKPRNQLSMNHTGLRGFEEAYWCDLNKWLEVNEPRLDCKFPDPNIQYTKFYAEEAQRNGGRYELSAAAWMLDSSSKDAIISMLDKLIKAAEMGELTVYNRGSKLKYQRPKYPTEKHPEVYWEARWNDLNEWLEKNERLIFEVYQFPDPNPSTAAAKVDAQGASPSGDDVDDDDDGNWITKCPAIAQKLGEKQLETTGAQQINASSMCEAVAEELGLDPTTHGRQGPRSAHNVRTEGLKGWKFRPPKIVKK